MQTPEMRATWHTAYHLVQPTSQSHELKHTSIIIPNNYPAVTGRVVLLYLLAGVLFLGCWGHGGFEKWVMKKMSIVYVEGGFPSNLVS